MSRNYVTVDQANKRVQFSINDVCSSVSITAKDGDGNNVLLDNAIIKSEVKVKGKSPYKMYEEKFSIISDLVTNLFKRDKANILPLSFKDDLALSDTVKVEFTITFDDGQVPSSFDFELNNIGGRTNIPFEVISQDISGSQEVDTEDYQVMMILETSKIDKISSEKSSRGFLSYSKEELESVNQSNAYIAVCELNQTYRIECNSATKAYLLKN